MVGAPILAYTTLRYLNIPFDFFMLWICLHYIVYAGISGHSGLRILMFPLTLSPLLSYFNAELSIEDHDLYHRYCWRITKNYGKQTRLWDRVFGTCSVRLESNASNIDYKNRIEVPFY
jgi:sterol desaturase/sphingolipid hydroxylase (fatty acid hydroxylase superfamily)